jgi:uncharacterized protein
VSAIYYLDSSAWVKRYFAEAGSSWMHSLFKSELALASTALGYVEVVAAIARRSTARQDFPTTFLQRRLMTEWDAMLQVEMDTHVFEQAASIAWKQKLRGADAIHLAAASLLRNHAIERSLDLVLVTSDIELIQAANEFGLIATNPAGLT